METKSSDQVGTRLLFENDNIRLWELVVEPGESLDEHIHRLDYMYFVTEGGLLRFADPANPSEFNDVAFQDNQVAFVPVSAEGRIDKRLTNVGDNLHRNYVIEVKNPGK
jgi:beta-alanine degradation protein BauB